MRNKQQIEEIVRQYVKCKQQKQALEKELKELRHTIVQYGEHQALSEFTCGNYRVKLIEQQRKEYDDDKLYHVLPDPQLWRMLSRADPAKISAMTKLHVMSEDILKGTYTVKSVMKLQVDEFR